MADQSAGILLYKIHQGEIQLFLIHPGGPFFKNKDAGTWSIPKGLYTLEEDPLDAAKREFWEETGQHISGQFIPLNSIKQKSGKIVRAWAVEGDIDANTIVSNTFNLEWPPRSGKMSSFPEVDKAAWFTVETAREKINSAQTALIEELLALLGRY